MTRRYSRHRRRCRFPPSVAALSTPMPWHATAAARRAASSLLPSVAPRSARIARAIRRRWAHNAVARERLFAAVADAVGRGVPIRPHVARRHAALGASGLAPALPQAHEPGEERGIAQDTLLCLTGKRLDQRGVSRLIEVAHHACARFVARSGRTDPAQLHAVIEEAARHALPVLVAHLDGGLSYRLRGGTAPVVLPAGEGVFLGRLRLLPIGSAGAPLPVIEAATWLHTAWLDAPQVRARDVLLAGLPPSELVAALPEAWAELNSNVGGDRCVLSGLAALHRQDAQYRRRPGAARRQVDRLAAAGRRRPGDRAAAQPALHRRAGLEPAALHEGPEHGPADRPAEPALGLGRHEGL